MAKVTTNTTHQFVVRHIYECDDEYGQPCARSEYVYHRTQAEAETDVYNSAADFGATVFVNLSYRAPRVLPAHMVAARELAMRTGCVVKVQA